MSYYRYDTHCHIFTLEYAVKEAKSICIELAKGKYPFQWPSSGLSEDSRNAGTKGRPGWREIYELLVQLYELLSAALTSEKENLQFLDEEMKKAYPGDDPRIVPLMMDIFYIIARPLDAGEDALPALRTVSDRIDMQPEWEKALDALANHIREDRVLRGGAGNRAVDTSELLPMLERERVLEDEAEEKRLLGAEPSVYSRRFDFHRTKGYCFHMDNLMSLVGSNPGSLYPFVAVDARRDGIVDAVCSGGFFTGKERFYGVKLYPRLGCHPLSKPMFRIYEYCQANNLPIIFHCGMGGFPPSEKWAYADYGNPVHFESILQKYPGLRIDFAHMGSSSSSMAWKDAVMALVNNYDNAYTDFSCYTDPDELARMKTTYWDANPKLHERLLFGTDFDVMYFTGRVTMQSYYDSFKKVFNGEMDRIMHDNPARFLGIG
jgi:predicted TIM-barrel fold metal-dependent hydrolase